MRRSPLDSKFPIIRDEPKRLGLRSTTLDGEIVVLDDPVFRALNCSSAGSETRPLRWCTRGHSSVCKKLSEKLDVKQRENYETDPL
jgi:hypothetical protein